MSKRVEWLRGGIVSYLSISRRILTGAPVTIAALSQVPLLVAAASSLLPLCPPQPTSFPRSSPSAFQRAHLLFPTHAGEGTSVLPAAMRTPTSQMKNQGSQSWRGDRESRLEQGRQELWRGVRTAPHSSVSPWSGARLQLDGVPD